MSSTPITSVMFLREFKKRLKSSREKVGSLLYPTLQKMDKAKTCPNILQPAKITKKVNGTRTEAYGQEINSTNNSVNCKREKSDLPPCLNSVC